MTPEERRKAQLSAMAADPGRDSSVVHQSYGYNRLLRYFDEHEPAVADAIRYGLVPELDCREHSKINHALCVDYPEGHPKS
jgi:hypothetical protein